MKSTRSFSNFVFILCIFGKELWTIPYSSYLGWSIRGSSGTGGRGHRRVGHR